MKTINAVLVGLILLMVASFSVNIAGQVTGNGPWGHAQSVGSGGVSYEMVVVRAVDLSNGATAQWAMGLDYDEFMLHAPAGRFAVWYRIEKKSKGSTSSAGNGFFHVLVGP